MPTNLSLETLVITQTHSRRNRSAAPVIDFGFSFLFVVFQQLEIDYIIGDSNRELLPSSTGPAAIIRIFGVTEEGIIDYAT